MHRVSTGVGGKGQLRVPRLAYQVVQDEGIVLPQRPILNFTGGGITATDDPVNNRTNVNVPLGAGVNMPINPDDDNKIAYALAGNFQYTALLRTDGTSITSVARTTVGTGAPMTVAAQSALIAGAGANVGASLTVAAGSAANGVASNTGGALNLASGAGATAAGAINLQPGGVTEATFTEGGAFEWAAGVAAPIFRQATRAAAGAAAGTRLAAQSSVVAGGVANTGGQMWVFAGLATQDGTQAATGGELRLEGGVASQSAAGAVTTTGGHTYIAGGAATGFGATGTVVGGNLYLAGGAAAGGATNTPGSVIFNSTPVINVNDLYWEATVAAPQLWQLNSVTPGGAGVIVGYPMVYHAQDVLQNNAGFLNTGGSLTVRAGNALNAGGGGTSQGGNLTLSSGTGTTDNGTLNLQFGGTTHLQLGIANTVTMNVNTLLWAAALTPTIYQSDRSVATGATMTIRSQASVLAGSNRTGGALNVYAADSVGVAGFLANGGAFTSRGGDASGVGTTSTGGAATFRGGDVTGVSTVASVGGSCTVRAGNATGGAGTNTGGSLYLSSGSGATADGDIYFQIAGTTRLTLTTGSLNMGIATVYWGSTIISPTFGQTADSTAGVTADLLTIYAQTASGTGAATGGALVVRAGHVTGAGTTITSGAATFQAGDVSGAFTVAGVGGATILRGGNVTNVAAKNSTGGKLTLNGGDCTGAVAAGTCQGGHVLMRGGIATATSGTLYQGNIAFHSDPASWQSGEKVMFFGDCTTEPTGNPTSGIFVWSYGQAGKAKGGTGTVTTWAASHPHCPRCGRDWALESRNDALGWHGALCLWCMVSALERAGVSRDQYMIHNVDKQAA